MSQQPRTEQQHPDLSMTITQLSLYVTADEKAMAEAAAGIIAEQSKEAIEKRDIFNIALSGGKTPIPLFEALSSPRWSKAVDWTKTVVYWTDER